MYEEFRSMAVAASFILKNSDASIVPLNMTDPMPLSWQLDKDSVKNNGAGMQLEISLYGGAGTSLLAVTLNNEDKRERFTPSNGSSPVPVYTGILDIGTGETLISVEVQAPDRATTVCYTISQSRAVTVTFDADGGEPASVQFRCIKGETLETLPANPSKDGYIFGGWFTEQNGGGTQFTASTLVNANMTVYAKWTYQVTFDADGGTPATSTASCLAGATVGLPSPEPTKASHLFGGWFTEPNGGGTPFTAATLVTANMTVYAKWIRVEDAVTVTFDAAGGTPGTSTATCAPGKSVDLPGNPTKGGYVFFGWYTEQNGGGTPFTATTPVNTDMTVYARWITVEDAVTVTFDTDGGIPVPAPITRVRGETLETLPADPARYLYTFNGWYTEPNGGGTQFTAAMPIEANMTVYAWWRAPSLTAYGILELGVSSIMFPNIYNMSLEKGTALTVTLFGTNVDWSSATWVIKVDAESVSVIGSGDSRIWSVPMATKNGQYTITVMVWIDSTLYVGNFLISITN
jgi:uncharacterized repeat protein (TIGR02543 family)